MADRLPLCLPFTLAQECPFPNDWSNPRNFSNDAHDPGGKTMCGIIQREYDAYRKSKSLPVQDVRSISLAEGTDIYRNCYWLPHCPNLSPGLDLVFFDAAVNEGSLEAIKILQHALHVANDGRWGPQTDRAVASSYDARAVIADFTARREAVYRMMAGFKYFGTDWERRSAEIGAASLKMAVAA